MFFINKSLSVGDFFNASDFQALSFFVTQPELRQLINERDPVLVVLVAQADQIRVVSRGRMSRIVMDLLLYQGLGKTSGETQTIR